MDRGRGGAAGGEAGAGERRGAGREMRWASFLGADTAGSGVEEVGKKTRKAGREEGVTQRALRKPTDSGLVVTPHPW